MNLKKAAKCGLLLVGLAVALGCIPRIANAQRAQATAARATTFAYVGSRTTKERNARGDGINVYSIDGATGKWRHVQLVKDLVNPSFLALDQKAHHLYAVHGDLSEVSAFSIDPASGKLNFINQQATGGKNPVHLLVDPTNKFLTVANYASGSLATLPINGDGSLGPLVDLRTLTGEPGPHKTQQGSSHPHQVVLDPAGKFLVVPDKGLDRIFSFRLDSVSGKLSPAPSASVAGREGSGTRHIAFHPQRPFAYVMNELDSTVTAYSYGAANAELTPLQILPTVPADFTGNNTGAEIAIASSGRFVYGSNRGHDSIVTYRVDPKNGTLKAVGWQPSHGTGPRFLAIDPTQKFLYVANENSDSIVTFRIDTVSGGLVPTAQTISTGSPVCIVFAEL